MSEEFMATQTSSAIDYVRQYVVTKLLLIPEIALMVSKFNTLRFGNLFVDFKSSGVIYTAFVNCFSVNLRKISLAALVKNGVAEANDHSFNIQLFQGRSFP